MLRFKASQDWLQCWSHVTSQCFPGLQSLITCFLVTLMPLVDGYIFSYLFIFGATPNGDQDLFLTFLSGITSSRLREPFGVLEIKPKLATCKGSDLPAALGSGPNDGPLEDPVPGTCLAQSLFCSNQYSVKVELAIERGHSTTKQIVQMLWTGRWLLGGVDRKGEGGIEWWQRS